MHNSKPTSISHLGVYTRFPWITQENASHRHISLSGTIQFQKDVQFFSIFQKICEKSKPKGFLWKYAAFPVMLFFCEKVLKVYDEGGYLSVRCKKILPTFVIKFLFIRIVEPYSFPIFLTFRDW